MISFSDDQRRTGPKLQQQQQKSSTSTSSALSSCQSSSSSFEQEEEPTLNHSCWQTKKRWTSVAVWARYLWLLEGSFVRPRPRPGDRASRRAFGASCVSFDLQREWRRLVDRLRWSLVVQDPVSGRPFLLHVLLVDRQARRRQPLRASSQLTWTRTSCPTTRAFGVDEEE